MHIIPYNQAHLGWDGVGSSPVIKQSLCLVGSKAKEGIQKADRDSTPCGTGWMGKNPGQTEALKRKVFLLPKIKFFMVII